MNNISTEPHIADVRVIADLDGTLSRVNTFTLFVKEFFQLVPSARISLATVVILRKMRAISHWDAKRRILILYGRRGKESVVTSVLDKIIGKLNGEVEQAVRGNRRAVLATAAPELYAIPLARRLGIPFVVATPADGPECRGEEKLRRLRCLGVSFHQDTIVYTDHDDDLPLLRANAVGTNIIIRNN